DEHTGRSVHCAYGETSVVGAGGNHVGAGVVARHAHPLGAAAGPGVHPVGGAGQVDGQGAVAAAGLHPVGHGAQGDVDGAVAGAGAHRAGGDLGPQRTVAGAQVHRPGGVGDAHRTVPGADGQGVPEAAGTHAAGVVVDLHGD